MGFSFIMNVDTIKISNYPELKLLSWNIHLEEITGQEAFALYESGWRYVYQNELSDNEKKLIEALKNKYGNGVLNV